MQKPTLTYFFEAEYYDGRIYKQNQEDASVKYPPVRDENGHLQGKSCMSDIQEDVDNFLIKRFTLVGKGNKITVNLDTGLFEVNGLQVLLESTKLPALPEHFRLRYYRQVTVDQNITYDKGNGEIQKVEQAGEAFLEYFIGWECEIAGKQYEQKIAVA
jgi:hypothetical protein